MNAQENMKTPYFPPLSGPVDCTRCEIRGQCLSADCFQRDRRDFTVTSRRCPRLPDYNGFMDQEQQSLYETLFPVVYATRAEGALALKLHRPNDCRSRKVYRSKSGYWYFRDKFEGEPVRRVLTICEACDKNFILDRMRALGTNTCVLRCTVEDYFV